MSPFWRGFVKGFAGADFEGFLLRPVYRHAKLEPKKKLALAMAAVVD